ncbi:virulence RhuM family protein [Desulfobacter postgatei]|uniref:virulence RhuM family protein n=1 Tax=Desulfobacter postgatei TaxID=2293 RepID=UPI000232B080|nr:virulence RhuM family protein [Desulfobacter postgatei]
MKRDKNKQRQKAGKKETSIDYDVTAQSTDREILQDAGRVTAEIAKAHAESEFEKYRIQRPDYY